MLSDGLQFLGGMAMPQSLESGCIGLQMVLYGST